MIKYKYFSSNIKKQEDWLDGLRDEGYYLVSFNPMAAKYHLEKSNDSFVPKTRIDYRDFNSRDEYKDYIALFEDSGWERIYGAKNTGYQYFRQSHEKATEEIFSDHQSKAESYKRESKKCLTLLISYSALLFVFVQNGVLSLDKLFNIKSAYYTPGLWDMTGIRFVRAFLFETPFALGRSVIPLLYAVIVVVYFILSLKSMYYGKVELREEKRR